MKTHTPGTAAYVESAHHDIAELGAFALAERDLPTVLDRAVLTVASHLGLDLCEIFKLSANRGSLQLMASVGWPENVAQHAVVGAGRRSQEGYTLRFREPIVCEDLAGETRFRPAPVFVKAGIVSSLTVVIEGETSPFGVLAGHSRIRREFSSSDVAFVQAVAHIITGALVRAHHERDRARLRSVVDSADVAVIGKTPAGTIFSWNGAAESMYGYSTDEVMGRDASMLFRSPLAVAAASGGASGSAFSAVGRRSDGTPIDVQVNATPIILPDGRIVGESTIVRDVSERKRHEHALRVHAGVLGQMGIGVVVWRLDDSIQPPWLRLMLTNPAGAAAAGFAPDATPGSLFVDLFPDADASDLLSRYVEVARSAKPQDLGDRTIGTPPAARVYHIEAVPLPGQCVGVIFHDVTEQRQLAQQLHHAQRMEVIGRLAGGIAHDFNNLLTVISGYTELLEDANRSNDQALEDIVQIKLAVQTASQLTRQLLTFGGRQVMRPTVIDLSVLVERMRCLLKPLLREEIQLSVVHGTGRPLVRADGGQVEQILLNLAVNARDAMPKGGRIVIETDVVRLSAAYAQRFPGVEPGRYALLAVEDSGIGMDRDTQERIFEPFFTTKKPGEGSGLGLSTVYGIVKQSGGHIDVKSERGQGSAFRIYLPLVDRAHGEPTENPAPEVESGS
jgi:two-component system, cell cycle sensor histidine kinase and response regulator CckA